MIQPDDEWLTAHHDRLRAAGKAGSRALELGSGSGRDTGLLSRLIGDRLRVTAADINADALVRCRTAVPQARVVQLDLGNSLPFRDATFCVVVASLSLHYFTWKHTVQLVADVRRCMTKGGLLIVRLNSTKDSHYGARSQVCIEENYYRVGDKTKRFFDEAAVHALFQDWTITQIEEQVIQRYQHEKFIWEAVLYD